MRFVYGVSFLIVGLVWWLATANHWTTYKVQHPGQMYAGAILFWIGGVVFIVWGLAARRRGR